MTLTATTKAFDPAVTTAGGDLWTSAFDLSVLNTFSPVIINPGQSCRDQRDHHADRALRARW